MYMCAIENIAEVAGKMIVLTCYLKKIKILHNLHLMWTSLAIYVQLSCRNSREGIFPIPDGECLHLFVLVGQITAGNVTVKRGFPA